MISRLVLWGRHPAGLLFIPWLGGRFQQVSPVDSRHVKRAMQTYNLLRSALPNPPKIIPFPHPHCFYALSIFFTCSALWRGFYQYLYVLTIFRGPKTKQSIQNWFSERAAPARSERYRLIIWLPWLVAQPSTCRSCSILYDNWNRKPVRKGNVSKPADFDGLFS